MSLYNLKSAEDDRYRITKFTNDLEPESSYLVSDSACECPQFVNRDKRCRHQRMLKQFLKGPTIRLDSGWFYDYDHDAWYSQTETSPEADDGPDQSPIIDAPTPPIQTQPIPTAPQMIRRRV